MSIEVVRKDITYGNRQVGEMPKIGIRPIIDARREFVRETLEEATMGIAQRVADLLSARLRHSNGLPVECVIADQPITGVVEARQAARKFSQAGVGALISVSAGWSYPSETMEMYPFIPQAVWGFSSTQATGTVYQAALSEAHNQLGLPIFKILGEHVGDIQDSEIPKDVAEKLLRFARSALAVSRMRGTAYLSIGGSSLGARGSLIDQSFFQSYLDMRLEFVGKTEYVRRFEKQIYDWDEYHNAQQWVRGHFKIGLDPNRPEFQRTSMQKERDWEISILMALITIDLMRGNPKLHEIGYEEESLGHNALAAGFQGQRAWADHLPCGGFMEAILNSSFDWRGVREPYILATENDALNAITMLWAFLLTGKAQIFSELSTYWSPDSLARICGAHLEGPSEGGFIHLTNTGSAALDGTGLQFEDGIPAIKPFWRVSDVDVKRCLNATTWYPALTNIFPGGGWSSFFIMQGSMPVTFSRLNLVKGLGPVLQIAEGTTVDLPEELEEGIIQHSNRTWPSIWFVPRTTGQRAFQDVSGVAKSWGSNRGVLSHGHIGADLLTLASILRIPVSMHNLERQALLRPSVWGNFGTQDLEGADFRACQALGPLYGDY